MQREQLGPTDGAPGESKWVPRLIPPFGQLDDFWKRYDTLADKKDKEMLASLNSNLDVLLIFAGLFSAVNTTFISFTMPQLSPDATGETNTLLRLLAMRADNNTLTAADLSPPFSPESGSVAANCLLYASLCCSLLAAMGAMIGKEWLQSYGRSGQAGPVEEQARFRQRKFTGAQKWHLESIIGFLPNLLLVSVLLFFAGLTIFLIRTNVIVARVVIGLVGSGVALGGATIAAGASSPTCPYQTALSRGLRRVAVFVRKVALLIINHPRITVPQYRSRKQDDIINGEATAWLLQATSDPQDQLAAVKNIYGLGAQGVGVIMTSTSFDILASLAYEARHTAIKRRDEAVTGSAGEFGTALCYVLRHLSDLKHAERVGEKFLSPPCWDLSETIHRFPSIIRNFYQSPRADLTYPLKLMFLDGCLARNDFRWYDFEILLSDLYDDTLLGMIAHCICKNVPQTTIADVPGYKGTVAAPRWNDYSGTMLLPSLVAAFSAGPGAWVTIGTGASTERILKVYNIFLTRIRVAIESENDLLNFKDKFSAAIGAGFCKIFRTPEFAFAKDPIDFIPIVLKVFQILRHLSYETLPIGWDTAYLTTLWSAVGTVIRDPHDLRKNAEELSLQSFCWTVKTSQLNDASAILSRQPEFLEYLTSCLHRKLGGPKTIFWGYFLCRTSDILTSDGPRGLHSLWIDHGLGDMIISMYRTCKNTVQMLVADNVMKNLCESSTSHSRKLVCNGVVDALLKLMQRVDEERESFGLSWAEARDLSLQRILLIWIEAFDAIKWTSGGWLPAMNSTLITWSNCVADSHLDRSGHFHLQGQRWQLEPTIPCVPLIAFLYDIRAQLPASDLEACDFNSTIDRFDSLFQKLLARSPVLYGDSQLPSPCYRIHFVDDRLL